MRAYAEAKRSTCSPCSRGSYPPPARISEGEQRQDDAILVVDHTAPSLRAGTTLPGLRRKTDGTGQQGRARST